MEPALETDELKIERRDRVAVLTIDRPSRRNALGDALVANLRGQLAALARDPDVGAVVIAGNSPGFCAGSDLKELGTMSLDDMCEHEARTATLCREIGMLSKPVLAAVEGFALGGGFVLATACDVIVTSRTARWNLPEVAIGWIPPWGIEAIVNRVGVSRARQLVWGGLPLDGQGAVEIGLADHATSEREALAKALDVARVYAALPDQAVAATKHYFAVQGARNAEGGDLYASNLFRDNCRHPAAKATLSKYGVKL
jgi:enoyl-CoA hydratase/carnithine racemase